jgi:phenylpropionate dioxygenase-like ring-hydroxylating dioxygenase large terminal subunit
MIDEELPAGTARCPGSSAMDVALSDRTGVPAPLLEESYEFLGDEDIAYERYTSLDFLRAEYERLWPRVWQWACREEHLPRPGSYYVYDIGDRSALIVRTAQGELRAYENFCRHRGTQLKAPGSWGPTNNLRCPFHGWTWGLDGRLVSLPCRWDFPHVDDEQFALPELALDTWAGFVFVNFDRNARPLREYLGALPEHFQQWRLEDRYIELHARKLLPANWKASAEAFFEAYHVFRTHSQAIRTTGDANAQYDVFDDHVSRMFHVSASPSPHLASAPGDQEIVDLLLARKFPGTAVPQVSEDRSARDVYATFLQQTLGEKYRNDFSTLSICETIDTIQYFLFPNAFFFPGLQIPMVYRFRPNGDDPHSCIFDLLVLRPNPVDGPPPPPAEPFDLGVEDSYTMVPNIEESLGHVFDQDTGNLAAQTRGFKGSTKPGQTLGNYQEIRTRHLHATLDRYLGERV